MAVCLLTGLILASCAMSGLKFTQLSPDIAPKNPELGRIYLYRPSSFGAAYRPDVLLNGEKVGMAISWGFFYVDRPPGNYEVVTKESIRLRWTRKVCFILEKGQTRFVRFYRNWWCIQFCLIHSELVDHDVGLSEVQELRYTGAVAQTP